MFEDIGAPELILILVVIMIFFGVGKLPEVGKNLGKAINSFKKAQRGDFDDEEDVKEVEEESTAAPVKAKSRKSKA
jgi:sec-independent protein translocase protein TatA